MKHYGLMLLSICGLVLMSTNAAAENGHTYNGSNCKPLLGSQMSDFGFGIYLENYSPYGRAVSCPIVVDEIANTSGTTRVYAYVTGTGSFSCTLYSMNFNGTVRQSRYASRTNSGWIYFPNITSDDYWGSYHMICTLPGRGRLNTIWLGEKD